jgi:signal transduction histidine kinase
MHGHADEIFLLLRDARGENVGVLSNTLRRTGADRVSNDCIVMRVAERQKYEAELLEARRTADRAQAEAQRNHEQAMLANEELEQQTIELEMQALELERLKQEADQASLAKSNFLAMMSHELRTPLNAISGYAQLLEMGVQGPVTDAQVESLARIQQSQRHLLRLVNEILNLARIESGHIEFDTVSTPVDDVVSPILPLVEPQAEQKHISLVVEIQPGLIVKCDVDKTQQVLLNLLSNAIKFTAPKGTVAIRAERGDTPENVVLSVRDTGVGIPADMIEAIFDPFVQVDVSRSRRGDGTGLGLAISRDLARGMNGDLTAHSRIDEGSTFYLTLPAGR